MQDLQVVDNFFDDLDFILQQANKQNYFTSEQLSYNIGSFQNWPGLRTANLILNPTLYDYLNNIIYKKFTIDIKPKEFPLSFHKRGFQDQSKDWIHKDPSEYAFIAYLSETNLNSGTAFFDEKNNKSLTVNFVQNRALLFKGSMKHRSLLNYGEGKDIRLTLNGFIFT